jgi:hypothetical protein
MLALITLGKQSIYNKWKCGCVFGAFHWGISKVAERSSDIWYTSRCDIQLKSNVHVEHTWVSSIWLICRMCDQGLVGCPPNLGLLENSWKLYIVGTTSTCQGIILIGRLEVLQWETRNQVRPIHVTTIDTIKCGKEWKNIATRSEK